jgi:hypothetical protein
LMVYEIVNWEWMFDCVRYSCTNALACECLPGACANQADPACPWALGPSCGVTYPCVYCYDNCGICGDSSTTLFCNPGCVTVSPCTPIPNAYFTAPANPSISATGCPWACNTGYTKSGSSCIPLAVQTTTVVPTTTAACPTSTYNNGTACVPCPTCYNGYYRLGCNAGSEGVCVSCKNTD